MSNGKVVAISEIVVAPLQEEDSESENIIKRYKELDQKVNETIAKIRNKRSKTQGDERKAI